MQTAYGTWTFIVNMTSFLMNLPYEYLNILPAFPWNLEMGFNLISIICVAMYGNCLFFLEDKNLVNNFIITKYANLFNVLPE